MMSDDSVKIDTTVKCDNVISLKSIIMLYIIFITIISDVFVYSVLSKFSGAVSEREPTTLGIFLQGMFLVIFYTLSLYLSQYDIL